MLNVVRRFERSASFVVVMVCSVPENTLPDGIVTYCEQEGGNRNGFERLVIWSADF